MNNPKIAGDGWELKEIVFNSGLAGILVGMFERDTFLSMALRWLPDVEAEGPDGKMQEITTIHGKETDWMILPFDFAKAIGKELIEKKVLGVPKFNEKGFRLMLNWLLENEVHLQKQ